MHGGQQIIREDIVYHIKQTFLADGGKTHQLQQQHEEREYRHQYKKGGLGRVRADSVTAAFAQNLQYKAG